MVDITLPQVGTGVKLFGADSVPAQVEGQIKDTTDKATQYGNLLDTVQQGMSATMAAKEANARQAADAHAAINAGVQTQVQALQDRARPVFARQAAIDARRDEVATMNPFKRAVLGFVNPNYNPNHLQQLHDNNQQDVQDIGQEYSTTTTLAGKMYDFATQRAGDQEAVLNAHGEGLNSQLALSANQLAAARAKVSDSVSALSADSNARAAQSQMQEQALSAMTIQQINAARADARKNGGVATVGGAQISDAQLANRGVQLQTQALDLQSHQLAVAAGNLQLKRAKESDMIAHMSPGDRTAAANAGGMWHGMQLDTAELAQGVRADSETLDQLSGRAATQAQSTMTMGLMDNFVTAGKATLGRVANVNGGKENPVISGYINQQSQQLLTMHHQLDAAGNNQQLRQKILSDWAPKMAGMIGGLDDAVAKATKGMSRDPDAQALYHSYLTGAPVDSGTATRGVIAFAKTGGIPRGINQQGPDGAAYTAGSAAYASAVKYASDNKMKKDEATAYIEGQVTNAMTTAAKNSHGHNFIDQGPAFARSIGHPAGRIDPADWRAARAAGDQNGFKVFAQQFGISVDDAQKVFGNSSDSARVLQKVQQSHGHAGVTQDDLTTALNQAQISQSLVALDNGHAARPGFIPSRAMSSLFNSPEYQGAVSNSLDHGANSSFGGFITDGVSNGGVRGSIYNYGKNMQSAVASNDASRQASYVANMAAYGGDPTRRAGAILGSIPGMDQHTEAVLLNHIHQIAGSTPAGMTPNDAIQQFIQGAGGKFQNPQLERMRQLAAKHWDDASKRTDAAVSRLQNPIASTAASM